MANKCNACALCGGNRWPDTQQGRDHVHLSPEERKRQLKLKHRTPKTGWNKVPNPRTNPAKGKSKSVRPRRKSYGPF